MAFDLSQISVPFRMQPGLRRIPAETLRLTALDGEGRLAAEKRAVVQARQSRHCVAGFDPQPALAAIAARGRASGVHLEAENAPALELAFEEDFAVLDAAAGTLPWLCVCVPSRWAPEDKLGLGFEAVHAPVADNAALIAASRQLVSLVTGGDCWERWVWTLTPSPRYDQHPHRQARSPWPGVADPDEFARQCWLRSERQTFFPVGAGTRQAVFTIRVMLRPLTDAVRGPADAQRLHEALASMSEAVLDYKHLRRAREPLLRWLRARS